jgi:bifunctional DNase/RNase
MLSPGGLGRFLLPTKGRQMIRVVVDSIRVSLLTQHRVVVLRETDSTRYLPIWIGAPEAEAIAMAIQGHEPQRPMTHDLLKNTIGDLGGQISHILVTDIQENTFFARIVIEQQGRTIEIDARTSDAIALAVRTEAPIYVETHVLDQAGVNFDDDEQVVPEEPATPEPEPESEPEVNDESMSIFRDFINTLNLDDPGKGGTDKS